MARKKEEREREMTHAGLSFEKSRLKSSIVPSTVPISTIGWLNLQHTSGCCFSSLSIMPSIARML